MPFTSGNVKTLNEFVDAMATYAVAQGWTLLAGSENQSDSGVFPINSRYYRLRIVDSLDNDIRLAGPFRVRATPGGANVTPTSISLSSGSTGANTEQNLLTTGEWDALPTDDAFFNFDFGANQLIRELVLTGPSIGNRGPQIVELYRSEDNRNWDLIRKWTGLSWGASETKILTLPADSSIHFSATPSGGVRRGCEYWLQGPGYDVTRRVYLGFKLFVDLNNLNHGMYLNGATSFVAALGFDGQLNGNENGPVFVIDCSGESIDYWLYVNSTRIIAVLRSAAGDYASFYAGFVGAFANPDQHSNPIYLAGTSPRLSGGTYYLWNEANTSNSCFFNPGEGGGQLLDWDGQWVNVSNNAKNVSAGHRAFGNPQMWVFPWSVGSAMNLSVPPLSTQGFPAGGANNQSNNIHWLKNLRITLQDELPVIDAIVQGKTYGHRGVLQGVIAIPGAASVVPEQVINVSGVNYRVFPRRTIREGSQWCAIAEI